MRILIDGYNLMHAIGLMKTRFGPGGLEKARRALVGFLAGSLANDVQNTTVVFDARVPPESSGSEELAVSVTHGIRVEFAAGEEDADARIEKLIRLDSAPKQLTVVSSDHRIRTAAKHRGARSVDSDAFWQELLSSRRHAKRPNPSTSTEKPSGRSTRESEFWLHEFDGLIDEQDLRDLAGPFDEWE